MPTPSASKVARAFWDGARLRCPNCHEGRMYSSVLTMRDHCPACGVAFEVARGEFTGAMMFAQGGIALVALMGWFVLYLAEVPWPAQLAWLVVVGLVIPLLTYRNMKGVWIGAVHAFDGLRAGSAPSAQD